MKKITAIILTFVAILIAVASRSEEQASVRSVEATETAVTTSVGITLGKEETPVKTEMSPEYTKVERKPIAEVTASIRTEIETTSKLNPATKQTVITTKPIAETTTPLEVTTSSMVETKPAETTTTEVSTKPIDTTAKAPTTESATSDAPESEDYTAEYKPSIGGDNPFDNPDDITIIDDRPVEDYINENENRPGEGIHF